MPSVGLVENRKTVAQALVANFVVATSIGASGLSLFFYLENALGSLGVAGVLVGVFGVGNAGGLVVQGHLVDRFPRRIVLLPAGALYFGSLAVLVLSDVVRMSVYWGVVPVVVAGVSLPAVTTAVRSLFSAVIVDQRERLRVYSWLTATFLSGTAIGPLVVSTVVGVLDPAAAVLVSAALGPLAVFLLPTADSRTDRALPRQTGRWMTSGLVTLIVSAFAVGFSAGAMMVAVPAAAIGVGRPEQAGVVLAAAAIGDIVGGLLYGHRKWSWDMRWRLLATQASAAVVAVCAAFSTRDLLLLGVMMFVAGLVGAPVGITTSALLDRVTTQRTVSQSFALITSAGLVSGAVGNAVAGVLAERSAPGAVFVVAGGAIVLGAVWVLSRQRTLDS